MSRSGIIDLPLCGETRRFRLAIGELEALQEATDVGAAVHLYRLQAGEAYGYRDVRLVLLHGLIGGGLAPTEAHGLASGFERASLVELQAVATLVLAAALEGTEDEELPQSHPDESRPALPDGKIRFADFYGAAAAMKLSAADARAMSLWQFSAYVAGHNRAADPDGVEPLTGSEADGLWEMIRPDAESAGSQEGGTPT